MHTFQNALQQYYNELSPQSSIMYFKPFFQIMNRQAKKSKAKGLPEKEQQKSFVHAYACMQSRRIS